LTRIAYRSGTHGDFLASMLVGLSRKDRPALARLRTRDADDATVALLDAFAVACDVLTFYSERLANESYLRSAVERTSLQELGKLVAYRLSPGAAAETWLAFSLERPPAPPPLRPPDPGLVPPGVPSAVIIPERLRVQSVPGPDEKPQTFETVEQIEARPEWNSLPVVQTKLWLPVINRVDAYLAGVGLNLARGDAILFASADLVNDRWDVRLLTSVEVDNDAQRTHVRWEYGLGSFRPYNQPADAPATYVLRKRLAVYGHNAPEWTAMHSSFQTGYLLSHPYPPGGDVKEWPSFTSVTNTGGFSFVDLDGAHPDVVRGSWVVLSQEADGFYRELYEVVERSELSRSEFGVSGKVTRLKLKGESHAFGSPRKVTVFAVSEPLTVVEAPDDSAVATATIVVEGDATQLKSGRTLALTGFAESGTPKSEIVTLDSVAPAPGGRTTLTLVAAPKSAYARRGAVVLANIARATNGETVTQILGSGDARVPFQTFGLQQSPLTFVQADNPRGTASTLEVQIDGVRWTEQPSTYGTGPRDRVFATRDEPDGSVSVVFGDGLLGARQSSGSNNIRATYRKGIGAAGNVQAGQLSQALDRPLGLKAVSNPLPATGGVDPEVKAHARASIPLPVRTLGRAVSLQDYADFALAYTGVAKASAQVLALKTGRTVVVTVADEDGQPPPERTVGRLAEEIRRQGDPNVRVTVLPCRSGSFRIALKVKVDPSRVSTDVLAAVEAALRAAYGRRSRALGAAVFRSAIVAAAAAVPGVVGLDLDRLYRTATPSLQERLLADPARAVAGIPLAAELLAIADAHFDWLLEIP
jgi:predicted phage baseplate assembly protein